MIITPKKRIWTVTDFARHAYGAEEFDANPDAARRRALRFLKRLDARHGGQILIAGPGTNREYTFFAAVLWRLEPDLFNPIESLEFRVEALEEGIGGVSSAQRMLASQVGQNTRDIAKLRAGRRSVA